MLFKNTTTQGELRYVFVIFFFFLYSFSMCNNDERFFIVKKISRDTTIDYAPLRHFVLFNINKKKINYYLNQKIILKLLFDLAKWRKFSINKMHKVGWIFFGLFHNLFWFCFYFFLFFNRLFLKSRFINKINIFCTVRMNFNIIFWVTGVLFFGYFTERKFLHQK